MRICDRCKAPEPKHHNIYINGFSHDLCDSCLKDYVELTEVITSMEQTFIKNKNLKHIDFIWEDNK